MDELHRWVFPFVAGSGEGLLPGATTRLDLTAVTEVGNGVVVLDLRPSALSHGGALRSRRNEQAGRTAAGRYR